MDPQCKHKHNANHDLEPVLHALGREEGIKGEMLVIVKSMKLLWEI